MTKVLRVFLFSFLLVFLISNHAFAVTPEKPALAKVETYEQLVSAIRQARVESKQKVAQEKVRLAWEIGNLIDEHILKHQERADYGKQVIPRLAKDLDSSETDLYYMLDFARSYPILPTSEELTWSDYRSLLDLSDPKQREELAERAKKEKWDVERIRKEIKQINAKKGGKELPLQVLHASPGKVGVYRVVKATVGPYEGQLALDLGFSNYYQPGELRGFKEGDFVFAEREREGYVLSAGGARSNDLYNYRAYVIKVIDGDTFTAIVDLGFEFVTEQKLRLRGLDTPELDTDEGQKAKAFLEQRLLSFPAGFSLNQHGKVRGPMKPSSFPHALGGNPKSGSPIKTFGDDQATGRPVLIKTSKSDKYDRYLADVFVDGKYLNEELIEKKLAEKVE